MRVLEPKIAAHLEQTVTTLCWAWRLRLKDGLVLGFTNHDGDLVIDGQSYQAGSGLEGGVDDARLGFSANSGSVLGILSSTGILDEDIVAGRYDSARIDMFRVNWADPTQYVHISSGRWGVIRKKGQAFEAEWIGHGSQLNQSIGRVFSSLCDAEFGDKRCGLDGSKYSEGTQCSRTYRACRDEFDNRENFRGFPYLLGDDTLQASPGLDEIFDGGSRYK